MPTIDERFDLADQQLRSALFELEALRGAVTTAYQHGNLGQDVKKLAHVPEVTRQLSIAITEAEGARMRLEAARQRMAQLKGRGSAG